MTWRRVRALAKRIPGWGWLLIVVTSPGWVALLAVASPVIFLVSVVAFLMVTVAQPRRIHITGQITVRSATPHATRAPPPPAEPGRGSYQHYR